MIKKQNAYESLKIETIWGHVYESLKPAIDIYSRMCSESYDLKVKGKMHESQSTLEQSAIELFYQANRLVREAIKYYRKPVSDEGKEYIIN